MVGFFEVQLAILAAFCAVALVFERYGLKSESEASSASRKDEDEEIHLAGLLKASEQLGMRYLGIYAIVMGQSAFLSCDGDNPRI
jgi:hypothetical protein